MAASTSLGDAAARGTGVTLATQALRAMLQFGSVVVLARLLDAEDFGLIAMVASVIGVSELIRDFGLSSAAIQVEHLSRAERDNLFWANLVLGAACCLAAILGRDALASFYDDDRLSTITVALACVFVLSGANTQYRTDLTRRLRFGPLAASDILSQALGIAVAISCGLAGLGYWSIVWQQLTVAVASLVVNAVNARWLPALPRRDVSIRRFFRFGSGLLGVQTIGYAIKNVDNIAIGYFSGAAALGLYTRAYQLLMTPLSQINAPMTRVALPVLSRVQSDGPRFESYLAKVQLIACYLTATVFTVSAALAGPLVEVIFGPQWARVAPIFAVLAIGGIFRAISQVAYWIYLARGMPGQQLRLYVVTGPIMIVLIAGGAFWGPLGVATGHSLAYAFSWVASLVHVGRVADVASRPLFLNAARAVLLVSAPCGLAASVALLLPVPALAQVLVGTSLAAAWALVAFVIFGRVRDDFTMIWGFARRAAGRV